MSKHVDRRVGATIANADKLYITALPTGWDHAALFFGSSSIPASGIPTSLDRETEEH